MKLAIVFSWLNQYGGAERVLETVHHMYPQAPIYTSIYWPDALPEAYRQWDVRPSFLSRLPLIRRKHQFFLPLYPLAFESLDLRGYDVILSLTSAFAHGIIPPAGAEHVCYCLTPARFLWNYHNYVGREDVGVLARLALAPFLKSLREWDRLAADRVDRFVAISHTVQKRIYKRYRRDSDILYPPVDIDADLSDREPDDYFLIVSRLVPYKRIDIAIKAFNRLGLPLRIVGEGRDRAALEELAKPNIRFLGYLRDDEAVREQMSRCKAFIFPGEEDFGIAPVEAMSTGRPVLAYRGGGALDTVVEEKTGLFFDETTPESLCDCVERFEEMRFNPREIREHAAMFSESRFRAGLSEIIAEAYRKSKGR